MMHHGGQAARRIIRLGRGGFHGGSVLQVVARGPQQRVIAPRQRPGRGRQAHRRSFRGQLQGGRIIGVGAATRVREPCIGAIGHAAALGQQVSGLLVESSGPSSACTPHEMSQMGSSLPELRGVRRLIASPGEHPGPRSKSR
jgi:hypothetical protein